MTYDTHTTAVINTLAAQRNTAMDQVCTLMAENAVLRQQLDAATMELATLKSTGVDNGQG